MNRGARQLLLNNRRDGLRVGVQYGLVFSSTDKTNAIPENHASVYSGHLYPVSGKRFKAGLTVCPPHGWEATPSAVADFNISTLVQGYHFINGTSHFFRLNIPNGDYYFRCAVGTLSGASNDNSFRLRDGNTSDLLSISQTTVDNAHVLAIDGTLPTHAAFLASPPEVLKTVTQGYVSIFSAAAFGQFRLNYFGFRPVSFA